MPVACHSHLMKLHFSLLPFGLLLVPGAHIPLSKALIDHQCILGLELGLKMKIKYQ